MRNLKLCFLLGLVSVFWLPKLGGAQVFVPKLGKLGVALGFVNGFDEKEGRDYEPKSNFSFRLDYVEYNTNLVIAYSYVSFEFEEPFVQSYQYQALHLGYRVDLDAWLSTKNFILSSIYFAFYPFSVGEEKFVTRDYQYTGKIRTGWEFDLGWRINQTWDIFFNFNNRMVGPFLVHQDGQIKKNKMRVDAAFIGLHRAFDNLINLYLFAAKGV